MSSPEDSFESLKLRIPTTDDIDSIQLLQEASFPIQCEHLRRFWHFSSTSEDDQGYYNSLNRLGQPYISLCAVDESNHVMGFISCRLMPCKDIEELSLWQTLTSIFSSDPTAWTLYLATLCVDDRWKRRGLASRLVGAIITQVRNLCSQRALPRPPSGDIISVTLHVLDSNAAAQSFYEKLGFEQVRVCSNHYWIENQYRDAFIMRRLLADCIRVAQDSPPVDSNCHVI